VARQVLKTLKEQLSCTFDKLIEREQGQGIIDLVSLLK
jgi:hypothetical protein